MSQLKMYVSALSRNFHGIITMPKTPVMTPPSLKLMCRGARLAKSLAGLTTLAAMLTEMVAMPTPSSATTATTSRVVVEAISGASRPAGGCDEVSCARMKTGSHSALTSAPLRIELAAEVMTTPMAEKASMVVGRPSVCPSICSRWPRPKRVKSGMLSDSVAQKPTMPVSEGTKTSQKAPKVSKREGCESMGPTPPARPTAHTSSTAAITSTSGAAQFSNTFTASMPLTMMKMFSAQKTKKVSAEGSERPSSVAPPPRCA